MKIQLMKVSDLQSLHVMFRSYRAHDGFGYWFRGQADAKWKLLPKAGRPEFLLPESRDLGRFNDWRNQAIAYGDLPSSAIAQLAFAQHHGLATRLLDWTMNPLVACFFACCELQSEDGAVHILDSPENLVLDEMPINGLAEVVGTFGYIPQAISPRVLNQRALFTVHCDAATEIAVRESRLGGEPNLSKLIIPSAMKPEVIKLLDDYGINRVTLFPDLDGLSAHINVKTLGMTRGAKLKN